MNKTKALQILRKILPWLCRIGLAVAALWGLWVLGSSLMLSLVFNGPSETARNQLTVTLLESEKTQDIPSRYLKEETIAWITAGAVSPAGTSDPSLIQLTAGGTLQTATQEADGFTAHIWLIPGDSVVQMARDGTPTILVQDLWNGQRYASITEGILTISDTQTENSIRCGHVLVMDGQINEALFAANSGLSPRAAIGQTADGTIIFITTDGWTSTHLGATYQDMIDLMVHYGAVNACLLDQNATLQEKEG